MHLIRLSSGGTELICEGLFSHPNEIWDLASCPFDQRIFSTVFSTGSLLILIYVHFLQILVLWFVFRFNGDASELDLGNIRLA